MYETKEGSEDTNIIRWINTGRIPLYLFVIWIQFSKFQLCINDGSSSCDIMTIFVPLFLMLLDVIVVAESSSKVSGFKGFAFLVSLLSLAIALHTAQPLYHGLLSGYLHYFVSDDYAMFGLAIAVASLSLIELVWFINGIRPHAENKDLTWEGTIRTY
jgi:hypothetical protein